MAATMMNLSTPGQLNALFCKIREIVRSEIHRADICPCPQTNVPRVPDLTTLNSRGFADGQRVYVTSIDTFFYFRFFSVNPPTVDNITVVATSQGGNSRYIREVV